MTLTRQELKSVSSQAWGRSDPVKYTRDEISKLRDELTQQIVAIGEQTIDPVQGVEYDIDELSALIQPGPGPLEIKIENMNVFFGGRPLNITGTTVIVPRPYDGVYRELTIPARPDGGSGILPSTFETLGAFASNPSFETFRDGVYSPIFEGVDYTVDLVAGSFTLIPLSPNILPGDYIAMTAVWSGVWSPSIYATKDGLITVKRGFTSQPSIWWGLYSGLKPGESLLAVINGIGDTTTIIDPGQINLRGVGYVHPSSTIRLFDGDYGHRHTGEPTDGPPVVAVERMEAAEDIEAFRAVSRDANGKAVKADRTDPARWNYVGISLTPAVTGNIFSAQTMGEVLNYSWAWSLAGHPYLYIGLDGQLEQASPTTDGELVQQIGLVKDTDKVSLRPRNRLIL